MVNINCTLFIPLITIGYIYMVSKTYNIILVPRQRWFKKGHHLHHLGFHATFSGFIIILPIIFPIDILYCTYTVPTYIYINM